VNKEELKKLLAELSDEDLQEVGLQKKTAGAEKSAAERARDQAEVTREITAQALATRDLNKALANYAATLKEVMNNQDKFGAGEEFLALVLGVESTEDAENLVEITLGLQKATEGLGNSIAEAFGGNSSNKFAKTLDSISSKASVMGRVVAQALENGNVQMLNIAAVAASAQIALDFLFTAFTSVATSIYEMSKTVILAFDQAQAKINATTATIYDFNDVLYESQRETNAFGISFEETGNALVSLNRGLSFFKTANIDTQKQLMQTVAGLTKFGISTEESTKLLSFFTNNLGILPAEADEATKQLAFLSTAIGIDPAKMTADFMKASSSLAVYGQRSVKVFSNIAAAAKSAEVETSSLLSLADKFDTFAGSAETTGKLNAILGTQLSALDMLRQSEDQRVETLIRTVQSTGVAFGQLDKFSQKAIAAAAGISDLNEAQRIFGMNIRQYREFANQQQKSSDIQQEFNDALKSAMPLVDKFKILFTEFIVGLTPVFNFLNDAMDSVLDFVKNDLSPGFKTFIGSSALIISGIGAIVMAALSAAAAIALGFLMPLNLGLFEMFGLSGAAAGALGGAGGLTDAANKTRRTFGNAVPQINRANRSLQGMNKITPNLNRNLNSLSGSGGGFARAVGSIGAALMRAVPFILAAGAALGLVLYTYSLIAEANAKEEEAKARQIEAYSKLGESISQVEQALTNIANIDLSSGILQVIELAEVLKNFDDVSIETKHTLTNLALITTGTAAEVMTAGVAGQQINVDNIVQNAISLEGIDVSVKIGEQEFSDAVMKVVRKNQ